MIGFLPQAKDIFARWTTWTPNCLLCADVFGLRYSLVRDWWAVQDADPAQQ